MLNAYLCWIDYPVLSPCCNDKYNGYHYNHYKYNYKVFNILVYYAFLLECPPVVSHLLVNCLSKISAQSPEGRWEGDEQGGEQGDEELRLALAVGEAPVAPALPLP